MATFIGINGLSVVTASAQVADECKTGSFLGFPTWYAYLEVGKKANDKCAIIGPKDKDTNKFSFKLALPRIVLAVIEIMLRIAGIVTVGFVIFGGFKYITSQGEPEALKNAQSTIINALIGMAITILAVTMVTFIGGRLW